MHVAPDISVSLAGVQGIGGDGSPRSMLDWLRSLSIRGAAIDGSRPGFRARELGRSARRDFAASMRRREIEFTGIDLWIPAEHFTGAEHCSRAVEIIHQTTELASEMASLVGGRSTARVSVMTPGSIDADLLRVMGDGAERVGSLIVDHRVDLPRACPAGVAIGVDPASVLIAGGDPVEAVHAAGGRLGSVRLDDVNAMGRCPVGTEGSRLDIDGYKAALIVGGVDWVTIDLRQLPNASQGFEIARHAWDSGLSMG